MNAPTHRESMRLLLLLCCLIIIIINCSAFVQHASVGKVCQAGIRGKVDMVDLFRASTSIPSELRLSNNNRDDDKVNVNLIDDVDSFTLTAVGFGLIAFNFFVLANVSG